MPRPEHIPEKSWAKALELLVTAPAMWTSEICAGTFINKDGELEDDGENCYDDYEDDYDEDYDEDEDY